jgi:UDP-3-O-[3-hydroxymyristoyl] glucosamine N-acyltransferase
VVDESIEYTSALADNGKVLLVVKKPRLIMAEIATQFFVEKNTSGIHPSATISEYAVIDSSAHIGAGCVIGKAQIGANTILMPNVVVYDHVKIGDNCLIQAGAVIGTDGLGCVRDEQGRLTKFPHLGGVIIGNDVEIGANCQIAKVHSVIHLSIMVAKLMVFAL